MIPRVGDVVLYQSASRSLAPWAALVTAVSPLYPPDHSPDQEDYWDWKQA